MSVVAELMKNVPAAEPYRAALEALERAHAELLAENERLKDQAIEHFTETWETLDGDAVRTLAFLARCERAVPAEVASVNRVHIQIAESYLGFLARQAFVEVLADAAGYRISVKGRRYLAARGLAG